MEPPKHLKKAEQISIEETEEKMEKIMMPLAQNGHISLSNILVRPLRNSPFFPVVALHQRNIELRIENCLKIIETNPHYLSASEKEKYIEDLRNLDDICKDCKKPNLLSVYTELGSKIQDNLIRTIHKNYTDEEDS